MWPGYIAGFLIVAIIATVTFQILAAVAPWHNVGLELAASLKDVFYLSAIIFLLLRDRER